MAVSQPTIETAALPGRERRAAGLGALLSLAVPALVGGAGAAGWCLWIWTAFATP